MARLELAASWSQTRRPTNWATPGYEVKEKFAKWSNMWSRKFYHSFAQLSTEVIGGNYGVTGECTTFGAVEPNWCSSSQSRRATNCATPGYTFQIIEAGALPVAVPGIFVGGKAPSSSADRSHSLSSLSPPPAAVASLPNCAIPRLGCILRDSHP